MRARRQDAEKHLPAIHVYLAVNAASAARIWPSKCPCWIESVLSLPRARVHASAVVAVEELVELVEEPELLLVLSIITGMIP